MAQRNLAGTVSADLKTLLIATFPALTDQVILSNPKQIPKAPTDKNADPDKPSLPHAYIYCTGISDSSGSAYPKPVKSVVDVYEFIILVRETVAPGDDVEARKHQMADLFRQAYTVDVTGRKNRFSIGIYPKIVGTDYRQIHFNPADGYHEMLWTVQLTVPQSI